MSTHPLPDFPASVPGMHRVPEHMAAQVAVFLRTLPEGVDVFEAVRAHFGMSSLPRARDYVEAANNLNQR